MLSTLHEKWYATFIEQWPDELRELGDMRAEIPLKETVLVWIAEQCSRLTYGDYAPSDTDGLDQDFLDDLESLIASFRSGAFLRLGMCSFKVPGLPLQRVLNLSDALLLLGIRNPPLALVCQDCLDTKYPVHLYVSEWREIPAWAEFRLFIRDRKIAGVSQYHHEHAHPEIQENLEGIKASLLAFSRKLVDVLHMDTVVVDVFVTPQDSGGAFDTTLMELNPYISRTDPCLYSWKNGGDFDGGIRYRKLRYNPYSDTTSAGKSAEPLGVFREEDYRRA